jgi:DNA-binding transcriptional regulator YiaG
LFGDPGTVHSGDNPRNRNRPQKRAVEHRALASPDLQFADLNRRIRRPGFRANANQDANLPLLRFRRRIRTAARASLRDVARELGVTPMTVARWETGSEPRLSHAIAYRRLLDQLREIA